MIWVTTPAAPPTSTAQRTLVDQHAAELLAAEEAAAALATVVALTRLTSLLRLFRQRWDRIGQPRQRVNGLPVIRLMGELATALDGLPPIPRDRITAAATEAWRMGVAQAWRELGMHAQPVPLPQDTDIPDRVAAAVGEYAAKVDHAAAIARATASGTPTTVDRIVGVARQGVNVVERTTRTLVNQQANAGIGTVTTAAGAQLLWVAERDACIVCLALAGHVIDSGDEFDVDATFGPRPMAWIPPGGLHEPPRHDWCRCRTSPWIGDDTALDSLPMVLRREAERSILLHVKRPSEPISVRQAAARRLMARIVARHGVAPSGWRVPASVARKSGGHVPSRTVAVHHSKAA